MAQVSTDFSQDWLDDSPIDPARVLSAVQRVQPDGTTETIEVPLIPLLDTTLLTNAPGEPRVGNQLLAEIHSSDRIDVVMAFIRRSGLRPLREALRRFCDNGGTLRVLTTTYTNSTEAGALDELRSLKGDVRVSYDTASTRLHAKAWLFHRDSGFSTAYIGSSNLTHSAQISGLEWNVRISGARNGDVIDKVGAVFEGYWQSGDFEPYDPGTFQKRTQGDPGQRPDIILSPVELRPEPFQERLLEQIAVAREQGRHRNLLVSATGTGKTVMAAVDYLRLRKALPRARLLFVAHREEILKQSLGTFRHGLRNYAFGELWVGREKPRHFEHVFASIQSLNAAGLEHIDPSHFDVVIIDEFHHAAAPSYQALIDRVQPQELLGLTATPERSDGLPILDWFDGRIAAELRLWDAIDQHRLTPFLYFGVHDNLDLREVPWKRGRGYDVESLSNLLTANESWAHFVLSELESHVDDLASMRTLGFCVSVTHARFMARVFQEAGLRATAVWGDSPDTERAQALSDLRDGKLQVVFSVDLFNEGIDVPSVDTLLLLRPTDSATLFLQQLGRGLRHSHGKSACTVLDFVGQHRKEFRFERRLRALLVGSRKDLTDQIEQGFPFLPAGCHMELDAVASRIVLGNIKSSLPTQWKQKAAELRQLVDSKPHQAVTLASYLEATGLELEDIYTHSRTFSDLCELANLPTAPPGPHEKLLRRATSRLLHVDDSLRIETFARFLESPTPPDPQSLPELDRRQLRMLVASVTDKTLQRNTTLTQATEHLWQHPQVRTELQSLLSVLRTRMDHVHTPLASPPNTPLQVHARYTRIEILAALGISRAPGIAKVAPWQAGVYHSAENQADLFAFTLDKTSGQFSPTTRYRDYAISRTLIHWESQSSTRADSKTGQRYQNHAAQGSQVLLFARLRTSDRAFWFLGPPTYVSHWSERPMAVTWRLTHPLPGDLFAVFAAAVA